MTTPHRPLKIRRTGRHTAPSRAGKVAQTAVRAAPTVAIAGTLVASPHAQAAATIPAQSAVPAERVHTAATVTHTHAEADRTYTVRQGDTLSAIAQRIWHHYGAWIQLYMANKAQITDPNLIYPGEVLTVPPGPAAHLTASRAPGTGGTPGGNENDGGSPVHRGQPAAGNEDGGSGQTQHQGGGTGAVPSGGGPSQALQQAAAARGWGSGAQWQDLVNVENAEAGFQPDATNPSSGAYGLAQALGHGTGSTACPTTGRDEYGGYGLTDAQAQAANCGQPGPQALWMTNYIAATYGTPAAAWAHEQTDHWY